MFYLKSKGINFAHPIKSVTNDYCEVIEDNEAKYIVAIFKEAQGKRLENEESITSNVLYAWGEVVAKMHAATKNYQSENITKRVHWDQEEYHVNIVSQTNPKDGNIYYAFKDIETRFRSYSKSVDVYGLIHADLHTGNFHVDENDNIMFFDFDDCIYSWFIYDIIVFLWGLERFDLDWNWAQECIFSGYLTHHHLDLFWIKEMPYFYQYRVILIYYYCLKALKEPKLDKNSKSWMQAKMKESKSYFDQKKSYPFKLNSNKGFKV
jgi:Ser/Thr protein kinase RdoA (MazF antagonist)